MHQSSPLEQSGVTPTGSGGFSPKEIWDSVIMEEEEMDTGSQIPGIYYNIQSYDKHHRPPTFT